MTSRERVMLSIKHEELDKVPIDFASTRSSGINAVAYGDLIQHLGHEGENRVFDMKQLLSEPDEFILKRMGADIIQLHRLRPSLGLKINDYKKGNLPDGRVCYIPVDFDCETLPDGTNVLRDKHSNIVFKRPSGGLYFDDVYHPLADAESESDIDALLELPSITAEESEYLSKTAKHYFENTEYAIIGSASISIFERGFKDFGYENYLVNMYTERNLIEYYLFKLTEAYQKLLDVYFDACGKYIQIIQVNDDLGSQNGPIINPKVYKDVFKPWHTKLFSHIKSKSDVAIFLHSCGGIYDFIPDFIETGVDILNPIQTNARGMDPYKLKTEFGKTLTFWGGGCNVQSTLPFGSIDDVRKETQEMVNLFKKDGGFIFAPTHNIQAGTSPQNIVAMYDTALNFR